MRTIRKWIRRIWITAGLSFMAWLFWNARANGVDPALLESSATVTVTDSASILRFSPRAPVGLTGLMFLPGAAVDPKAYVPLLRAVANAGYPVALVRLPWRSAPTASSRGRVWERIVWVQGVDSARQWVLAGHSRGAALSAHYAAEHPKAFVGLVLIGTTHPKRVSLAALSLPVTKIYGTEDCVADSASTLANAALLPPDTRWVRIEGANHQQFGWYGAQLGDCTATITRASQQAMTLTAVLATLKAADGSLR